ncbi:MAG: thiamine pyrophosphate-binding protein [Betaproteobacteria bacterium]
MYLYEYVAFYLKSRSVDLVFTITGAGDVRMIEALRRQGIDYVCPHHEQAGVMASLARYRLSGRPAVTMVTGGPGATNTISGIADAYLDSIPCIIIAGQERSDFMQPSDTLRGKGIQGLQMVQITTPLVKYAHCVMNPHDIRAVLDEAFHQAFSGRPGPVWVEIPQDLQNIDINPETLRGFTPPPPKVDMPKMRAAAEETLRLLQGAQRPLLWVGHGIRLGGAEEQFRAIFDRLGVPALVSWNGADLVPDDHPLFVGRAGTYGQRWANLAVQNCDALICLGTRLAIPQRGYVDSEFARAAKKVVVEIDPDELNKLKCRVDVAVLGDVKDFLLVLGEALSASNLPARDFSGWSAHCAAWREKYPMSQPQHASDSPINSYNFIDRLSDLLDKDDVIVTDMGTSLTCTHAGIRLKTGQRLVTSTGLGEMGYGLPGAIGASLGAPDRRVILIAGEGSLMMNLQEFQTAVHLKLPLKIILLNNNGYLTIKHTHRALFGESDPPATAPNTGVSFPDFARIAAVFGFSHARIDDPSQIDKGVTDFLATPGPAILEVMMAENQLLIPKAAIKVRPDGSMYSPPLEDMFPFLPEGELKREMIIPTLDK